MSDTSLSSRLSVWFSCVGHTFSHWVLPIFSVVALAMEREFQMSHGDVVTLIVLCNVLYGAAAPLAGWLGDRWSAVGMMGFYFLGTGSAMLMAGFAKTPLSIAIWLAATGLFASIYHPVGMAWLVRNSVRRGFALGVNGAFGAAGPAVALLAAGFLIDTFGWRWAFIVPGATVAATGLCFVSLVAAGVILETKVDRVVEVKPDRSDTFRVIWVLVLVMIGNGIIYQATQIGLPKVFSERVSSLAGEGAFGVSSMVAVVYLSAGFAQMVIGRMADAYPVKKVYIAAIAMQIPVLLLATTLQGIPLLAVSSLMVIFNIGALPAENLLVARYSPSRRRGLFFGFKFIITLGVTGGAGVLLEGKLYDLTGGFFWLFVVLATFAVSSAVFATLLPVDGPARVATAPAGQRAVL